MPKDEAEDQESASLDSLEEEEEDIGRRESRAKVPLRVVVSNVGDDSPNPNRRVYASKKAARKPLRMPTGVISENSEYDHPVDSSGTNFFHRLQELYPGCSATPTNDFQVETNLRPIFFEDLQVEVAKEPEISESHKRKYDDIDVWMSLVTDNAQYNDREVCAISVLQGLF